MPWRTFVNYSKSRKEFENFDISGCSKAQIKKPMASVWYLK